MNKKTEIYDENIAPIGAVTRVDDFLPPPAQLVKREEKIKVTLELTKESVDYFKEQAKREHVPYQRMLRGLIDQYAKQQQQHT